MATIMEPGTFHPMTERMQAPALAKLSATCKTWRDAAGPAVWRALCVVKWPLLQRFSVRSCDWKQRYATLSQCGAPASAPAFNIDEYEFFLSARAVGTAPLTAPLAEEQEEDAKPPVGAVKAGPILFSCTATWQSKMTHVGGDMLNLPGGPNANGIFLKATLPSPLALPEGLLTVTEGEAAEGGSVVEGMQPLHFTVHAHHKPLGTMAHMLSFQLPDFNYDFELDYLESQVAGVGAGDWQARMQQVYPNGASDYEDHGFCHFETPDWLGNIKANFGTIKTNDKLMVRPNLELDDKHRLLSVECMPCRYGDEDVGLGPAPFWEVPMGLEDLPAVCRSLQWA